MEMGSLTHYKVSDKRFKQTSYFKDFKRESLYIRWVNNKIWLFLRDFCKYCDGKLKDVLKSDNAKELTSIFKNFLNVKNKYNFDDVNLGLSSVDEMIQLKKNCDAYQDELEFNNINDDEFHDFFEEFITFTHRIFLKNEEDYEDDIFDINEHKAIFDNDDDDDDDDDDEDDDDDLTIDIINSIIDSDSDSESDSDSDSDSESD